jgi:lipoate-protein ligase B
MPARRVKLGRISFDDALRLQDETIDIYRRTGYGLPVIYSLEHDPVITCGRSANPANLLLSEDEYRARGIEVRWTDRGGDVTYHGPGQVLLYPIVDLREAKIRAGDWVRILEEAMIETCADFDVQAFRRDRMRGCWTAKGKIGAVGTAVKSGGITKHGIAFNVRPALDHFSLIVPCGISTSHSTVARLVDLTDDDIDQDVVEDLLVEHLQDFLDIPPSPRPS